MHTIGNKTKIGVTHRDTTMEEKIVRKVRILMGMDSSYKAAYLKEHIQETDVVLSEPHPEKVLHALSNMTTGTLYVNGVLGSRTKRRKLYHAIKGADIRVDVTIVFVMATLATVSQTSLVNNKLRLIYMGIQVPRIGVDCDHMVVAGESFFRDSVGNVADVAAVFEAGTPHLQAELKRVFEPHQSPWHAESIEEHINMAVANAPADLKQVALFHDLGKSVAKQPKQSDDRYMSYHQHERVSAHYFLNYIWFVGGGLTKDTMSDLEVINQHMAGHGGINHKTQRKNGLDATTMHRIQNFAKVDQLSKISE